MTLNHKLYAALILAVLLVITFTAATFLSERQIRKLEQTIETQKQKASTLQSKAAELELAAEQYRAKTSYLEQQIAELGTLAQKQDEELQILGRTVDTARRTVADTRRIRTAATTAADLCRKLADLGHPCE